MNPHRDRLAIRGASATIPARLIILTGVLSTMRQSRLARFLAPITVLLLAALAVGPTAVHAAGSAAQSEGDSGTAVVLSLLALLLLLVVGVIGAVGLGIISIGYKSVTPDDD